MDRLRETRPKLAQWFSERGIISARIGNVGGVAGLLHSLRLHGRSLDGILKPVTSGQAPELAEGVGRTLIYALILTSMYGLLLVFAECRARLVVPDLGCRFSAHRVGFHLQRDHLRV